MGEFLWVREYDMAINTEARTMTTNTVTSPANGIVTLVLGVLAAGLVFLILTGRDVPIVGSGAGALLALGVIGIAMCTLSGIGSVQSTLNWTHPLTIIGSILGVAAVLVVVLPLLGVQLPLIADTRSAVLALAAIMLVKVGLMGVARFIA
jgi:uncharacterized membrane protein required for colicin V production